MTALNTPFLVFAFRWDVIMGFVVSAAVVLVLVLNLILWLFRGVKWL